jgi:hypothetical protein
MRESLWTTLMPSDSWTQFTSQQATALQDHGQATNPDLIESVQVILVIDTGAPVVQRALPTLDVVGEHVGRS